VKFAIMRPYTLLTEWSYHKGGLSLYPNIEAVLLMSFTEVHLTAVT